MNFKLQNALAQRQRYIRWKCRCDDRRKLNAMRRERGLPLLPPLKALKPRR